MNTNSIVDEGKAVAGAGPGLAGDAAERIVDQVRERYGRVAAGGAQGCCAPSCCGGVAAAGAEANVARGIGYDGGQLEALPEGANLGLGCGAPLRHLGLAPGETVLDLGSGGGIDAFLAAREVGPNGRVLGVDMTPEMIERARAAAARGGYTQVEFRSGRLEALPVDDSSIDAVTSNCVINLVPDKGAVFREVARVLRPGGRLVVSDIVLERPLPAALAADLLAYVGCVAGAETRDAYFARPRAAGLGEIEILEDRDYLALLVATSPEEVEDLERRTGISRQAVAGTVRSITYRARRPAGAAGA